MTVKIGTYTIANAFWEALDGVDATVSRSVQQAKVFRADNAVNYDRKNAQITRSFGVDRKHSGVKAAAAFQALHGIAADPPGIIQSDGSAGAGGVQIPATGTMVFSEPNATDGTRYEFAIAGAIIQNISVKLKGRTTKTTYTVVGNSVSQTMP